MNPGWTIFVRIERYFSLHLFQKLTHTLDSSDDASCIQD